MSPVQLVKTTVYVEFATALAPWLGVRDLMRIASGDTSLELQGQPIVMDQPDKKQRITHLVRSITVEKEGAPSPVDGMMDSLNVLQMTHEEIPLPEVRIIRSESIFIEPYPLPFHELVSLIKTRYLQESPIVESATDVGVNFDYHEDEIVKHLQLGPMQQAQLRSQYLKWPPEQLPDCFAFLLLGYERNQDVAFDSEDCQKVLETAAQWQLARADDILTSLIRIGG